MSISGQILAMCHNIIDCEFQVKPAFLQNKRMVKFVKLVCVSSGLCYVYQSCIPLYGCKLRLESSINHCLTCAIRK